MFKFVVFPEKFSKKKKSAESKNEKRKNLKNPWRTFFPFFSSKYSFNNNQRTYN